MMSEATESIENVDVQLQLALFTGYMCDSTFNYGDYKFDKNMG